MYTQVSQSIDNDLVDSVSRWYAKSVESYAQRLTPGAICRPSGNSCHKNIVNKAAANFTERLTAYSYIG